MSSIDTASTRAAPDVPAYVRRRYCALVVPYTIHKLAGPQWLLRLGPLPRITHCRHKPNHPADNRPVEWVNAGLFYSTLA